KHRVHFRGNAAMARADLLHLRGRNLMFREPIDHVESRSNVRDSLGAENFRGIQHVRNPMRGDYLLKRFAIPRLTERQRASGPDHAMEKYRLPHGKLDGRKTVARRSAPGKTQSGRRSDRKLSDPAHRGGRGVNMKRVPPLQHEYFKT